MDNSERIKHFLNECDMLYKTSDGTIREGHLMYNNALQRFPKIEFNKITHTILDPFYDDNNIEMFIEFLKKEIDGK